jgi:hypothetical protein
MIAIAQQIKDKDYQPFTILGSEVPFPFEVAFSTSTDIMEIGRLIARESDTVICTNCPGLVALAILSDAKVKIY